MNIIRRRAILLVIAVSFTGCDGSSAAQSGNSPTGVASLQPAGSPSPSPVISPSGGTIFFGRAVAGRDDQFVLMSPDGSIEHELDIPTFNCVECGVGSPDGRLIGVPVENDTGVGTAVLNVNGEGYVELPRPAGLSLAPRAFSPGGDRLAFDGWSDDDPSRTGTYTSALDGSDLKQIVASPDGRHYIPMGYSPNGRLLLLHRDEARASTWTMPGTYSLSTPEARTTPAQPGRDRGCWLQWRRLQSRQLVAR